MAYLPMRRGRGRRGGRGTLHERPRGPNIGDVPQWRPEEGADPHAHQQVAPPLALGKRQRDQNYTLTEREDRDSDASGTCPVGGARGGVSETPPKQLSDVETTSTGEKKLRIDDTTSSSLTIESSTSQMKDDDLISEKSREFRRVRNRLTPHLLLCCSLLSIPIFTV